uniref:Predicted gene, 26566 n=1 Tax=Mus spicilegus TaxID=10103 RepID=A0A8C6N5Z0_MUSSI
MSPLPRDTFMGEAGARSELQAADVTKRTLSGNPGAAEPRASKRSPQHRSGHTDVRPAATATAAATAARTSNLPGERVSHHPGQLRDRFTSSGPGLSSFAAALRAGEGPSRPAHPGCRPPRLSRLNALRPRPLRSPLCCRGYGLGLEQGLEFRLGPRTAA